MSRHVGHRAPSSQTRWLVAAVATIALSVFAPLATANGAEVNLVSGSAFGESVDITISAVGAHIVSGPRPTVTLPATGGHVNASQPSVVVPPSGPATGNFATTGALIVDSQGTLGAVGSATSSAMVVDLTSLGGGFSSPSVASACASDSSGSGGSTAVAPNSTLRLSATDIVTLPTSPAPNTTFNGTAGIGDTFTAILNEQTSTVGDGNTGVTVNAVHLILHGPRAIGNIVFAQTHCDSTVSASATPTLVCALRTPASQPPFIKCRVSTSNGIRRVNVVDTTTGIKEQSVALPQGPLVTTFSFQVAADGNSHRVQLTDVLGKQTKFLVSPSGVVGSG